MVPAIVVAMGVSEFTESSLITRWTGHGCRTKFKRGADPSSIESWYDSLHLRKDNRFESCVGPTGSLFTGICPQGGLPGAQEVCLPDLCLLRCSQDGGLGLEGCHS
jgi:hypothetical protein